VPPSSVITSLTNATVKLLAGLRLQKHREEHGLFLMEGLRTAQDAARAGAVPKILAVRSDQTAEKEVQALVSACHAAGGRTLTVTSEILAKITQKDNPQGVVGAYAIPSRSLSDLKPGLVVALERVRDPGNLGTVIRTADAVGAAGVVLIGPSCDAYSIEATRAGTGSIFHVPVYACREDEFIALAKKWPGEVVGTAMTAKDVYRGAAYKKPALIVMGTEQSGLSDKIAKACTRMVRIPMPGRAESLNLSVAAALMLYAAAES
jgi:TrmH family RNA methyltransferase